jgi:hypothetical protein
VYWIAGKRSTEWKIRLYTATTSVWADPSELSVRILGKYEYAEWADMRAHFAFNYPCDIHILIDLPRPKSGIAFFADMYCFQLPGSVKFLVAHLGPALLGLVSDI